jgi:tryptophanyl-tRNA synthetase
MTPAMRYLSGIQPSGIPHLGNYFGAMRQHVARQAGNECFYFIADFHALTTVQSAQDLRAFTRELAADYLAVGLDPARSVFFRQSDVPEVTELAWILGTVTPFGLLERCHSYKDKLAKGIHPSFGLFAYPVLMAADIIIYDSQRVPVGEDQIQHIEVTRDIAGHFNQTYGETLVLPEHEVEPATGVVPGIDGKKMSKSYRNTIEMFAPEKEIRKRVMAITTDSRTVEEPKEPEKNPIYQLYLLMASPEESDAMAARFRAGGYGYGDAKKELLGKILDYFGPFRAARERLLADPGALESVLREGAARARAVAGATLDRVRRAVGIV